MDLEPAIGFWNPKRRKCVPQPKMPVKLPDDPTALLMSYTQLFTGHPDQVKHVEGFCPKMSMKTDTSCSQGIADPTVDSRHACLHCLLLKEIGRHC